MQLIQMALFAGFQRVESGRVSQQLSMESIMRDSMPITIAEQRPDSAESVRLCRELDA